MPGRDIVLAKNQYYHVFNRGVDSQKIFSCERDYFQFLDRIAYYRNKNLTIRFSQLSDLPLSIKSEILSKLANKKDFLIDIVAYCLMPNHFHFLLKQNLENGISKFVSNFSNSYTRYYNIKHKRVGPILQGKFKAVLVNSDEQILHLSRYIHLNPYPSGIVKNIQELLIYPYSSMAEYLNKRKGICKTDIIMEQFNDDNNYRKFVTDQADYQLNLQLIKKQILES